MSRKRTTTRCGPISATEFLRLCNSLYSSLSAIRQRIAWVSAIHAEIPQEAELKVADQALSTLLSDPALAGLIDQYLTSPEIDLLQRRQLERLCLLKAENPVGATAIIERRNAAEAHQTATLNRFQFELGGQQVTAASLLRTLQDSDDLNARLAAWNALMTIGVALGPGLVQLRDLRNGVARAAGYPSYWALQAADYGMSADGLLILLQEMLDALKPLSDRLRQTARDRLRERFGQDPGATIPVHWFTDQWGQAWGRIAGAGLNLDSELAVRGVAWIADAAAQFWTSIGFPKLPDRFWHCSDIYPVPPGKTQQKMAGASTWHIDLDHDVRALWNLQPDLMSFGTAHHELGHAHYYYAYSKPSVPPLLRRGLNRAMHEAVGDLARMACLQPRYLKSLGLIPADTFLDRADLLLKEALELAVPLFNWSAGTVAHFEYDIYHADLPADCWQERWWDYSRRFQGIAPPGPRPTGSCDAATKRHLTTTPCYYYNYALSTVIKYQLYEHICLKIVDQDPLDSNFFGEKQVGAFLMALMELGSTQPWPQAFQRLFGEGLSVAPMQRRFASIMQV